MTDCPLDCFPSGLNTQSFSSSRTSPTLVCMLTPADGALPWTPKHCPLPLSCDAPGREGQVGIALLVCLLSPVEMACLCCCLMHVPAMHHDVAEPRVFNAGKSSLCLAADRKQENCPRMSLAVQTNETDVRATGMTSSLLTSQVLWRATLPATPMNSRCRSLTPQVTPSCGQSRSHCSHSRPNIDHHRS